MRYEKDLISVIIPCYNQGEFIDSAIQSVLKQSYQNFEIIVINDCSTDKTTNVILSKLKIPKVKVVLTSQNSGLANARNLGFQLSKGQYIQFLDADDMLNGNKFKDQLECFNSDPELDICYSSYKYYLDDTGEYMKKRLPVKIAGEALHGFVYDWQRSLSIPIHCALFNRRVWKNGQPFVSDFKAIEDWIVWVQLAYKKRKFGYIDKEYAIYRIHKSNMTIKKDFLLYWVSRAISYIATNYIDQKEKAEFDDAMQKYLKFLIDAYYLDYYRSKLKAVDSEIIKIKEDCQKEKEMLIRISDGYKNSNDYLTGNKILILPRHIKKLIKNVKHSG